MAIQGPITFQDVAASFTEQQWLLLEDWQKEIYKTVIKEIHEAIISLGYTIINPNIVFSVRKPKEPPLRVDDQFEVKNAGSGDLPDLLLKIKDQPPGEAPVIIEEQTADPFPSSSSAGTSSFILNVKEESSLQRQTSVRTKKSNSLAIKAEEEAYTIDAYNIVELDKVPSPTGDCFFKHESDEETDNEEEFQVRNGGYPQSTGESTSLAVETKKRKVGSQVSGDILSLQEREARRLRVLEGTIDPFPAQPSFMSDPNQEVKKEITEVRKDIKSTSWCKCGNCCVMPTLEESVCCHEITGLISKLNEERVCITNHSAFKELCLDYDRLDFLYRFLAKIKRKNDVLYHLHKLRRTAYRAFVVWAHGFLDFRNFKPIPACVVNHIQEYLPYPEDLNVGYMKMYDYPAAIMALDHI